MIKLKNEEIVIFENMLRNLGAEEQELDINSEKPLVYHKEHKQLSFIINGSGYIQTNKIVEKVERGNLILMNENTDHSFLCVNRKMTLLHLHFPKIVGDEDRYIKEEICSNWIKLLK